MMFCFFVAIRASLIAASTASAPEFLHDPHLFSCRSHRFLIHPGKPAHQKKKVSSVSCGMTGMSFSMRPR